MKRKRQSKLSRRVKKEEATSIESVTPAALLNDVVLQNIFKYLGYKDLKSVRDVKNCIWLRNSKKAWWSRTKVTFVHDGTPDKIGEYLNQTDIHSYATNYKFDCFKDDFKGFWDDFGHSIKYLELEDCSFDSLDAFHQLLFTKCPNLEKLVAIGASIGIHNPDAIEPMTWEKPRFGEQKNLKDLTLKFCGSAMPISWMELLSHFPSLEALETRTHVDIYKVISVIRQHDPKKLKLKHININILSEESCRLVLLDPNLKLETIYITDKSCRPETLVDILDLHAKSLKFLSFGGQIIRNRRCDPIELSLRQPLVSLEKLKIVCCLFTKEIFKFTPNLREVHLNYDGTYNLLKNFDPNLRIDTCKELRVGIYGRLNSSKSDLPFFLSVFPNLEILRTGGLDNSKFSMICERWTKLVSFFVHSDSLVDDFGLLGFDPKSKSKTARVPNITNLKSLRTFSMESKQTREKQKGGKAKDVGIEMKNGDVVLRELEKLTDLKTFELKNYELKKKQDWKDIFARYPID